MCFCTDSQTKSEAAEPHPTTTGIHKSMNCANFDFLFNAHSTVLTVREVTETPNQPSVIGIHKNMNCAKLRLLFNAQYSTIREVSDIPNQPTILGIHVWVDCESFGNFIHQFIYLLCTTHFYFFYNSMWRSPIYKPVFQIFTNLSIMGVLVLHIYIFFLFLSQVPQDKGLLCEKIAIVQ